jgi:glycoprotein endo-alpha-1,2-mannosidase
MRLLTSTILIVLFSACGLSFAADATTQPAPGQYNLPGHPPYLLAHFMQWYSAPWSTIEGSMVDRTAKDWSHWQWKGGNVDHHPDNKSADGRRDIASVLYPLIGPYDSGSRAVIRYHLATMKAAGISAVTSIWYGPGSNTDKRFPMLLDEADKLGMRAAICYEEKLNFPTYRHPKDRDEVVRNATSDLTYIVQTYGGHPAYLKRNGLPVIQQFNASGAGELGPHKLTPDEFRDVFDHLPGKVVYVRQNLLEMYHPPIAGAYVWWDQSDWPKKFSARAATLRDQGKLDFFMTMVCPGFNDTGVWGWGPGPRVSKGYGIDVLRHTEEQALDHGPELVQCVTWNDFNEATCFEPTVEHGFDFVNELERWWGEKTGRPVDWYDNRAAFEQYKRECSDAERAEIPTTMATR